MIMQTFDSACFLRGGVRIIDQRFVVKRVFMGFVYIFSDMSTNLYACLRIVYFMFTKKFTCRQTCTHRINKPCKYVGVKSGLIADEGLLHFRIFVSW